MKAGLDPLMSGWPVIQDRIDACTRASLFGAISLKMRVWPILGIALLLHTRGWGQSEYSPSHNGQAHEEAVRRARQGLVGRTDETAMVRWSKILDEMHLAGDPGLKKVVQELRGMNLYDNRAWIGVMNVGYAYLGDSDSSRRLNADIALQRPNSAEAINLAIGRWDAAHAPEDPSEAGMVRWQLARLAFLQHLHEQRPHSSAATQEYLNLAMLMEVHLPAAEALRVADLAAQSRGPFLFDRQFQTAELYLHHHVRLERVPNLLTFAINHASIEDRDRAQLRADSDLAEYWLAKGDKTKASFQARKVRSDLLLLASRTEATSMDRHFLKTEENLWMSLARRVGIDASPVFEENKINWSEVPRDSLGPFSAVDLAGHRWTLQDWKGKTVLVTTWATWCAPCRAELPVIERLQDAFQLRKDRLVVTINVDSSEALARHFIQKHHYTFPVIRSISLATRINADVGLPQNRLLNPRCEILVQPIESGSKEFVNSIERWMDEVK
jgi:thiol-disulfide isomerase/thioredoxin